MDDPASVACHVHVHWMIRCDMREVLQIEQDSFEFAWTGEDFLRCLAQRYCIGMVAEQEGKVVGFVVYELCKASLNILNIAVSPACRRQGLAKRILAKLKDNLSSHRRTRITLDVRETNLAAQVFFRSQGFQAIKVLHGFYEDSGEDAYRMEYRSKEYRSHVQREA